MMVSPHNGVHHGRTKDPFSRHLSNPGCSPRKMDAWRVSKLSSGKTRFCGGCFIRGTLDDSATSPWNIYEKNRVSSFRHWDHDFSEAENTTRIRKHQATNVNINLIADMARGHQRVGDFPLTGPSWPEDINFWDTPCLSWHPLSPALRSLSHTLFMANLRYLRK
jgi:hypothetical protein